MHLPGRDRSWGVNPDDARHEDCGDAEINNLDPFGKGTCDDEEGSDDE